MMKYVFFACLTAALLAGCGYKGDLYLPDGKTRQQAVEQRQ